MILNLEFVKMATAVFSLLTGHLELSDLSFNNSNEIIFSSSFVEQLLLLSLGSYELMKKTRGVRQDTCDKPRIRTECLPENSARRV